MCMPIRIFEALLSGVIASLLVAILGTIDEDRRQLRKLIEILRALENECVFNNQHRGNSASPFQLNWIKQSLDFMEFYEYCPNIASKCLETYELMNDANMGQLARRKKANGVSMVCGDIQDKLRDIIVDIEKRIPELKRRSTFFKFIWFQIKGQDKK